MRNLVLALILLSVIISCGDKNKPKLIPKAKLIEMMVDLNIQDALALDSYISNQLGGIDSVSIYSAYFSKYEYSKEDFDYTLEYYSNKPKKLITIYDAVFAELSKKSDELKVLNDKFSYSGLKNIWNLPGIIRLSGDTIHAIDTFDVKIDSVGTYVITAQIKMTTDDKSENPRITAYFYNPKDKDPKHRKYYKNTQIFKSTNFREYQIYKELTDPKFTNLHIIVPDCDNKDSLFFKSFEMNTLTVAIMREEIKQKAKK